MSKYNKDNTNLDALWAVEKFHDSDWMTFFFEVKVVTSVLNTRFARLWWFTVKKHSPLFFKFFLKNGYCSQRIFSFKSTCIPLEVDSVPNSKWTSLLSLRKMWCGRTLSVVKYFSTFHRKYGRVKFKKKWPSWKVNFSAKFVW